MHGLLVSSYTLHLQQDDVAFQNGTLTDIFS